MERIERGRKRGSGRGGGRRKIRWSWRGGGVTEWLRGGRCIVDGWGEIREETGGERVVRVDE